MRSAPGRAGQGSDVTGGGAGGGAPSFRFLGVLQGVGVTFIVALACALVIGLAVAWTPMWDASDGLLKVMNLLAIAAGGLYAGRKVRRLGWLHGGLVGLVYVLLVSWMIGPEFGVAQLATTIWLREALYAFVAGALGGVVGVAT